jgi:hypothetical protein
VATDPCETLLKLRTLIAAIRIQLDQEWKHPKHGAHQQHATVAVLHISGVDQGKQQQTLCIYRDMALLAFDLLAGIIAWRVDLGPPFSAALTL